MRALGKLTVILKIGAGFAVAYGEAGAEEAGGKRGDFGDVDFLAVESGAFAACGCEKFIVKRIEDRGGEERILLGESDRDAEARIPVSEIRGAVERIDVPAKVRSRSAFMPRSLFGSNGVIGEIFGQPLDDQPFRTLVRLRDKIDFIAFVGDVKRPRQFFDQGFSGFLSNFNGGFEIVLRH